MIDAYEVGIQLLLQEDVSAGLAVINQGLAEVDKAIAATSADLAGLAREAEIATKAVTTAVGGRTASKNTKNSKIDMISEQIRQSAPKQEVLFPPATELGEKAAAPHATAAEPALKAKLNPDQTNGEHAKMAPELPRPTASSSAPVRSDDNKATTTALTANTNQMPAEANVGVAVAPAALNVPLASEVRSARSREIAPGDQKAGRDVTPPVTPVALKASVTREQRSALAGRQPERARPSLTSEMPEKREKPVAPWSGIDQTCTQADTMRLHERASAPQSAGRGQAEFSGGTVMLDGRLVGQWLSEHMGREASRPPAGTSFFDPRQTPAWNVSGAL